MLELIGSWILSVWQNSADLQSLRAANLTQWVHQTSVESLIQPQRLSDQVAMAAVFQHLKTLEDQGVDISQQGIWIQSGRHVLAEHEGTRPLPAASLTKLATTLVALKTWGADHQFETQISYTGTVQNQTLVGDLIIEGGGDPLFVWEEAIALGNALQEAGISAVEGDLIITGPFAMNFEADPETAGRILRRSLHADFWPPNAQEQFATMPPGTPRPTVSISGEVRVLPSATTLSATPLIRHRSVPLIEMLKLMNIYSNNFMAESLAEALGGASAVAEQAAALTLVPEDEIQLINGSGLGTENRISARATCAMLMATQHLLADAGWSVGDVLPVAGLDMGTIRNRKIPVNTAVKTGTLAVVSSLAGGMPAQDNQVVWFAIINWGADLDGLREQQDVMLGQLARSKTLPSLASRESDGAITEVAGEAVQTGSAIARHAVQNERDRLLGDPERNEILVKFD